MVPAGRPRVLIVEDEYLVAMEAEFLVRRCGCAVVGPVATVSDAMEVARHERLEGAVIDVNLGREMVWPVVDLLAQHGVPYLLATGYDWEALPTRFRDALHASKPLTLAVLRDALQAMGTIPRLSASSPGSHSVTASAGSSNSQRKP